MEQSPLLAGYTVIDLSSVGPASRCSRILADYGARVIKVGPPPEKIAVQIKPPFFSYSAGRGLECIGIDIKAESGRELFVRLAESADVVIESFRPGVADRLGVGHEELGRANPDLVYCSTSGYGQNGPNSRWAGHDLNYLAVGGFLHCSSRRVDGSPAIPGSTVADAAAGGMHAVIAILAALLNREKGGGGRYLDVSVAEGVLSLMSLHVDEHLATASEPGPGSGVLTGRYACYDLYAARDGKWLSVAAIEPVFWSNLCEALGCQRWSGSQTDDSCQEQIREDFRRIFAERDRDRWVDELAPLDTCIAPVYSVAELVDDRHFTSRGAVIEVDHPQRGRFRQLAPLLAGMNREGGARWVGDSAGDTDALLAGVGLSEKEIKELRKEGVVA